MINTAAIYMVLNAFIYLGCLMSKVKEMGAMSTRDMAACLLDLLFLAAVIQVGIVTLWLK